MRHGESHRLLRTVAIALGVHKGPWQEQWYGQLSASLFHGYRKEYVPENQDHEGSRDISSLTG